MIAQMKRTAFQELEENILTREHYNNIMTECDQVEDAVADDKVGLTLEAHCNVLLQLKLEFQRVWKMFSRTLKKLKFIVVLGQFKIYIYNLII